MNRPEQRQPMPLARIEPGLQVYLSPEPDRAFLTGSHVYGEATAESDIDLVVLVEPGDLAQLVDLTSGETCNPYEGMASFPLRFGRLNLIAVVDQQAFDVWRKGTDELLGIANRRGSPVTREEACAHFKALREAAKERADG